MITKEDEETGKGNNEWERNKKHGKGKHIPWKKC